MYVGVHGSPLYGYTKKASLCAVSFFVVMYRERLARVKVFIDLLLDKKPKFGGEKIAIGD